MYLGIRAPGGAKFRWVGVSITIQRLGVGWFMMIPSNCNSLLMVLIHNQAG